MDFIFCIVLSVILIIQIYKGDGRFSNIVMLGFLLRIAVMVVDLNQWFTVLHSGGDTENFHLIALRNNITGSGDSLTNYTSFLTLVYSIFMEGNPRMVAQFINVVFGTGAVLIVRRCVRLLGAPQRIQRIVIILAAFLPEMIILSSILLREAWVQFFVALSLLYFLKWFLRSGNSMFNMAASVAAVFVASYMHPGVIGFAVGYFVAFIFYNPKAQRLKISFMSIFMIVAMFGVVTMFVANMDIFGDKFTEVALEEEYIEEQFTDIQYDEDAGSTYMQWLDTSSLLVGVAALPLRMFYFMFSPLPFDWRGMSDIIAFMLDALVNLWLFWKIVRTGTKSPMMKRLRIFLLVGILLTTAIFALGTTTSGTAMRHRTKFRSVLLVTYAVSQTAACTKSRKKKRYSKPVVV